MQQPPQKEKKPERDPIKVSAAATAIITFYIIQANVCDQQVHRVYYDDVIKINRCVLYTIISLLLTNYLTS